MKGTIFGIIITSLILITPVYAFSFNDMFSWVSNFFGRITGYATNIADCPYECCLNDPTYTNKVCEYPKTCKDYKCIDVETTSTTTTTTTTSTTTIESITTTLEKITTTTVTPLTCTDSDDGANYYVKGVATDQYGQKTDYCSSDKELVEYWCKGSVMYTTAAIPCSAGCKDGACLQETVQPITTTTTQPIIEIPIPVPTINEQVKCVFLNSNDPQACYADTRFGCKGTGTCIAGVSGKQGEKLTWKSTCGGYASTVIDGNNEYAEFKCEQVTTPTPTSTPPGEIVKEQVKCLFSNSVSTQKCVCDLPGIECEGIGSCVADVSGERGRKLTWKSTCGGYAYTVIDSINEYAEFACEQVTPSQPQIVKEQVKCVFHNSKVLTYPHTTTEDCYTSDGMFTCKWDGNVAEEDRNGERYRYAYCVVEISGEKGTKLTWKSTCGGYAYTVIDGNAENAEFQCIPDINVTKDQISGKGFKKAYWQCYDGTEQLPVTGETATCWTSEYWQKHAENFCTDHCKKYDDLGITKCGVNSFSVSEECYTGEEGTAFIPPEQTGGGGGKKFAMPPDSKPGDVMLVYFYMDNCPHCSGMDEELDKVAEELFIDIKRINIAEDRYLAEGYDIVGVPTLILLKYDVDGIKEYMLAGKTSATTIVEWITKIKGSETIPPEKPKEEVLICKDSCPLEGKCYPFGYRKSGKFCSDDSAFKDQLKGDGACENNFECESNVCVSGRCVSSGLIEKIINWFKRMFGSE